MFRNGTGHALSLSWCLVHVPCPGARQLIHYHTSIPPYTRTQPRRMGYATHTLLKRRRPESLHCASLWHARPPQVADAGNSTRLSFNTCTAGSCTALCSPRTRFSAHSPPRFRLPPRTLAPQRVPFPTWLWTGGHRRRPTPNRKFHRNIRVPAQQHNLSLLLQADYGGIEIIITKQSNDDDTTTRQRTKMRC